MLRTTPPSTRPEAPVGGSGQRAGQVGARNDGFGGQVLGNDEANARDGSGYEDQLIGELQIRGEAALGKESPC